MGSWLARSGELVAALRGSREGRVTVTLSDGRTPPIRTFGPLWLCEWVSKWVRVRDLRPMIFGTSMCSHGLATIS
jgi:hypothetical protein